MKMINIITEEMIMKIIPLTNKEELSFSVDENSITYEAGEDDDSYMIDFYDLARFLFVDAWDYFEKKGWSIQSSYATIFTDYNNDFRGEFCIDKTGRYIGNNVYPSRLHALAAAVAYMWEQEEKKEC